MRAPVRAIPYAHGPRLTAYLAILHVVLRSATTGIEGDLDWLVAIRAVDGGCCVGGSITKREFVVDIFSIFKWRHHQWVEEKRNQENHRCESTEA